MYAIHKQILLYFGAFTNPSFGAIKPALTRLETKKCLTLTKIMSDGGKLSIFYSITKEGEKTLKKLLLTSFSGNPVQFFSDARIKLSCSKILTETEQSEMYNEVITNILLQKIKAEKLLGNEYAKTDECQKAVLTNTIAECNNLVKLIEEIKKL